MRPTTPATDFPAPLSGPHDSLIARAKSLELDTPYVPPPGDPLEHHAAGFAKIMCSAVFITGLDPDFAAENVGYFTAPYEERGEARQAGHRSRDEGGPRHAAERRDAHRASTWAARDASRCRSARTSVIFTPVGVQAGCPTRRRSRGRWAIVLPDGPLPPDIDAAKVQAGGGRGVRAAPTG